jgi:RNA recognition motif-containing protein
MNHQGFGFCEFLSEEDADYAVKIMNQIKLYGKPIRVNKASYDTKKPVDVGANLFIGSLDEGVDENALFDTFSTFGSIAEHPKVRFLTCVIGRLPLLGPSADGRLRGIRQRDAPRDTGLSPTTTSRRRIWLLRT